MGTDKTAGNREVGAIPQDLENLVADFTAGYFRFKHPTPRGPSCSPAERRLLAKCFDFLTVKEKHALIVRIAKIELREERALFRTILKALGESEAFKK